MRTVVDHPVSALDIERVLVSALCYAFHIACSVTHVSLCVLTNLVPRASHLTVPWTGNEVACSRVGKCLTHRKYPVNKPRLITTEMCVFIVLKNYSSVSLLYKKLISIF